MNRRPGNETPRAVRRSALDNTGTWASTSGKHANSDGRDTLCLAPVAMDAARQQLSRYTTATNKPAWCAVDPADLREMVAASVADAATGGPHHVGP